MPRILIAYHTTHGHTARVAKHLASAAQAAGHTAETHALGNGLPAPDPAQYDAILVGGRLHFGRLGGPVERFVREHAGALANRPNLLFTVGLAAAARPAPDTAPTEHALDRIISRTGWRPENTQAFAGRVAYTRYGWLTRAMMKRIAGAAGLDADTTRDHEYTDWDAITRVLVTFLSELQPGATAPAAPRALLASP